MSSRKKQLKEDIKKALADPAVQQGLKKAVANLKEKRPQAFEGKNFSQIQKELKHLKQTNLENLKDNLQLFKHNAEKNGMIVIETRGKEDTCKIILEILHKYSAKKLVKSKSLVSDEIDLNGYLASYSIQAIETDLGEWLVQLAGEKPSHLTGPAIHMSRERAAEVINKTFQTNLSSDPKEITAFARKKLREEFLSADAGLTGANILVAETGSVIVVSNEGNARLVSSLPPVHIVITTPEKLVKSLEDAAKILDILPKSATGQNITSYVSIVSAPSKTADIEKELVVGVHGPKEVYVIIMDGNRKKMAGHPIFSEALQCLKCGACLDMCPVYQNVGGHVFGRSYFGGIGAILTAFIENIDAAEDLNKLCAGCGICKNICPVHIDIPKMNLALREHFFSHAPLSLSKESIIKTLFSNKGIFETSLSAAALFNKLIFARKEHISALPGPLSGFTGFRTLPNFARKSLKQLLKEQKILQDYDAGKKNVVFFSGCLIERFYPHFGVQAIDLLQKAGYNVLYPESQTCCGVPALYSGDRNDFEKFIQENSKAFKDFQKFKPEAIITLCPSCTSAITSQPLLKDVEVYDISRLIYTKYLTKNLKHKELKNITYHPSCHHSVDEAGQTYTHKLLTSLYSNAFVVYSDMYNCCGAAGSYALEFPDISERIIQNKINNILASKAETIVLDCPGCYMQFDGYIRKQSLELDLRFISEIFDY